MSVIFFESIELANVAIVAANQQSYSPASFQEILHLYCRSLAHFSTVNAQAFARTYREEVKGHTLDEIREAAKKKRFRGDLTAARNTVRLLGYNAVANDGHDFLTGDVALGLLPIYSALVPSDYD